MNSCLKSLFIICIVYLDEPNLPLILGLSLGLGIPAVLVVLGGLIYYCAFHRPAQVANQEAAQNRTAKRSNNTNRQDRANKSKPTTKNDIPMESSRSKTKERKKKYDSDDEQ